MAFERCVAPSTVSSQDVSPDEDSSGASDVSGLVWSEDFAPSSATAVRVHFLDFDVNAGTTRTGKDYVQILDSSNVVVQTLTGDLGSFWGPWVSGSTAKVRLYGDAVADGTGVVVVDKLEYTTATNGRFVMHLRMPGQIWDEEVSHAYNYQRWYRAEDGRYTSPDAIGLAGGEIGYFAYANSNPSTHSDPSGLLSELPDSRSPWRPNETNVIDPDSNIRALKVRSVDGIGIPPLPPPYIPPTATEENMDIPDAAPFCSRQIEFISHFVQLTCSDCVSIAEFTSNFCSPTARERICEHAFRVGGTGRNRVASAGLCTVAPRTSQGVRGQFQCVVCATSDSPRGNVRMGCSKALNRADGPIGTGCLPE